MSMINRVKEILLKPKEAWVAIEGEEATPTSLYKNYLLILAAIPAVCGFIGMSLIGIGGFGFSIRIPILSGLTSMVVQYVMSLIGIYVLALIINALAPTFGGQKNQINALKLSVYASTASMLGGIFSLLPTLALLGVLCSLYSIYLIYLGLPTMMKNPQEKSVVYTIVVLLVAIVIGLVMAAVVALVTPNPYKLGRAGGSDSAFSMKTPGGEEIKIDTAKMEAAGKKLEEAQKSGDVSAMAKATGDVMAAATGGDANVLPLAADTLKPYLLPQIFAFKRTSLDVQTTNAMGLASTIASADYRSDKSQMVFLTISDFGGMSAMVRMGGSIVSGEKETATSAEKTWQENGRTLHQEYDKDGSRAAIKVILKNGIVVELKSQQTNIETLRSMLAAINLNGLENTQRPKKS